MANNFEITIIDQLVADLILMSDDLDGKSTIAFQNGVQVVPSNRISSWVEGLDSKSKSPSAAIIVYEPVIVDDSEDAPTSRVQFERIRLGIIVVMRGPKDRKGTWRGVLGDFIDLWNRVLIQTEASGATLLTAGKIADGPDGSPMIWSGEVDRPDDLAEEYLVRGRMAEFGEHYGTGRSR